MADDRAFGGGSRGAGQLDRRITIQRKTVTQDEYGQEVETWADLLTVWGRPRPDRGEERFAHVQLIGSQSMTFTIRWRPDINLTIEDRIAYDGRTWDIVAVRELGRRHYLEIDTKARVDT